jgi:hypothetical protein
MNSKSVADGIAARFVGVTATVSGVSKAIALGPTASLPNEISKGPALLVYPPRGVLDIGESKLRKDMLDFPVRLLTDPLNYPQRSDALYAWYDALRDRVEMNMDLDLAYVAWAQPISARLELDGEQYAGVEYDVIEFIVRVRFNEVVSSVSV